MCGGGDGGGMIGEGEHFVTDSEIWEGRMGDWVMGRDSLA